MITAGIISEYNPFHNGHLYQIKQAREALGCSHVISVMSGSFLQRGLPAVCDKFRRAEMAVSSGIDAVFELPTVFATSSARDFAYAGVNLLNKLNSIDYLIFGAECDDLSLLETVADILNDEPIEFSHSLKNGLAKGMSYPAARANALNHLFPSAAEIFAQPNNILAIEYLSALKKTHSSIKPYLIKRTSADYNSREITGSVCSASAIRHLMQQNSNNMHDSDLLFQTFDQVLPPVSASIMKEGYLQAFPVFEETFTSILQYRLIMQETVPDTEDMTEELYNKFKKINLLQPYSEISKAVKSKNITQSRINRAILHFILDIRKDDMLLYKENGWNYYGHLLGLSRSGSDILRKIKKNSSIPIITKPADGLQKLSAIGASVFMKDVQATRLYNSAVYNMYQTELPDDFTARIPVSE